MRDLVEKSALIQPRGAHLKKRNSIGPCPGGASSFAGRRRGSEVHAAGKEVADAGVRDRKLRPPLLSAPLSLVRCTRSSVRHPEHPWVPEQGKPSYDPHCSGQRRGRRDRQPQSGILDLTTQRGWGHHESSVTMLSAPEGYIAHCRILEPLGEARGTESAVAEEGRTAPFVFMNRARSSEVANSPADAKVCEQSPRMRTPDSMFASRLSPSTRGAIPLTDAEGNGP